MSQYLRGLKEYARDYVLENTGLKVLALLITAFSGFPTLFKQYHRYTIVFPEAPGVSSGTPVRRSGVRIGEVHRRSWSLRRAPIRGSRKKGSSTRNIGPNVD